MRSCPRCERDLPSDSFRPGKRPCIDCIRAEGRERERKRRERDGERIRAADRARVRPPEQRKRASQRTAAIAMQKRREAGIPPRRKGPDPLKLEARKARLAARRRVPVDQLKRQKYASPEERREAFNARRRGVPRSERELARHSERQKQVRAEGGEALRARERERARLWRLANPEAARRKAQRDTSRRTARKRNADVRDVSERDLQRLLDRQRGCCFYCDQPEPTTLDHLIPLVRGGRHSIGNLVWACRTCNTSKGGRLVVEYRFGRSYRRRPAA